MKKILFTLMLFAALPSFAQSIPITSTDRQIISLLFGGEWQQADSIISAQLYTAPGHPKYHFLKAYSAFYSRFVGPNTLARDQVIDQVTLYSWQAINAAEKMAESVEKDFFLSCSYDFLCRANSMRQQYWYAYWNAKKSRSYLERVLIFDPSITDAYFALGIQEYYPARALTGFRGALAWLGGMSGNRAKGIEYVTRVAEQGDLFRDEANYALTIMYDYGEDNVERALGYWTLLKQKFPRNRRYSSAYEFSVIRAAIARDGVQILEKEFSVLRQKYNITSPGMLNTIGYQLMGQQRHTDALVVFNVNLKLYPHVANCYDSIAECYANLGDRENAIKHYKIAYTKADTDTTIRSEFRTALKRDIPQKIRDLGGNLSS